MAPHWVHPDPHPPILLWEGDPPPRAAQRVGVLRIVSTHLSCSSRTPKAASSPVTSTAHTSDQVFLPLSEVTGQDFL